jgi:ferredoxin
MKYKIVHVRAECIGCTACAASSEESWEMDQDGKSDLKKSKWDGETQVLELDELKSNMDAAQVCPVNCIHIYENGKLII